MTMIVALMSPSDLPDALRNFWEDLSSLAATTWGHWGHLLSGEGKEAEMLFEWPHLRFKCYLKDV